MNYPRLSNILAQASILALVAGFFLPWVHARAGFTQAADKIAAVFREQTDPGLGWEDFILLDEMQIDAATKTPTRGTSGYRIFDDLRHGRTLTLLSKHFSERLLGPIDASARAWILAGVTLLGVAGGGALFAGWGDRRIFGWVAALFLALYIAARWRVALSEGAWMLLDIHIGLGLWLWCYGLLAMALACAVRALWPQGKYL